jgi:hypothetical protein
MYGGSVFSHVDLAFTQRQVLNSGLTSKQMSRYLQPQSVHSTGMYDHSVNQTVGLVWQWYFGGGNGDVDEEEET